MSNVNKTVVIVGTGTIGEPLIVLLSRLKEDLGIDEVYFHKHTPLLSDKTKVVELLKLGAKLCVSSKEKINEFKALGLTSECTLEEAIDRATVVIDNTPSGVGIDNKEKFYETFAHNTRGFIAQGSEEGFGKPYAFQINDEAITSDDQYIQVVSCNTHSMAALLKTLTFIDGRSSLEHANFVCIRRATDISQYTNFIAAPTVTKHKDWRFGTHHAKDVCRLFNTLDESLEVFSSAIKIPSQYMHIVYFRFKLKRMTSVLEIQKKIMANPLIATTEKMDTGTTFSFARDHSPLCGRVLNQAIVPISALHVDGPYVLGYSFTPQDGNSLLSSVVAVERFLYPDSYKEKIECLRSLVFQEV